MQMPGVWLHWKSVKIKLITRVIFFRYCSVVRLCFGHTKNKPVKTCNILHHFTWRFLRPVYDLHFRHCRRNCHPTPTRDRKNCKFRKKMLSRQTETFSCLFFLGWINCYRQQWHNHDNRKDQKLFWKFENQAVSSWLLVSYHFGRTVPFAGRDVLSAVNLLSWQLMECHMRKRAEIWLAFNIPTQTFEMMTEWMPIDLGRISRLIKLILANILHTLVCQM